MITTWDQNRIWYKEKQACWFMTVLKLGLEFFLLQLIASRINNHSVQRDKSAACICKALLVTVCKHECASTWQILTTFDLKVVLWRLTKWNNIGLKCLFFCGSSQMGHRTFLFSMVKCISLCNGQTTVVGILMMVYRQGALFHSNGLQDYSFSFRITNGLVRKKTEGSHKKWNTCYCFFTDVLAYGQRCSNIKYFNYYPEN